MPEVLNSSTPDQTAVESAGAEQTVDSGTPDLSGKSTSELAELLGSIKSGEKSAEQQPQGQPKQEPKLQTKPDGLAIPDKFKNPDGTPNIAGLLKSYDETSKQMHRLMNTEATNRQLQEQLAQLQQKIESISNGTEEQKQGAQLQYTPEELEMLEKDPKKFIELETEKRVSGKFNELMKEQTLNSQISAAVNKARAELPGFQDLEPEIEALADKEFIGRHPEAIPFMYYATLGQKTEALVNAARSKSYQEGYEKAKADMKLQVEGGGKDTTPADLNISQDSLEKMSSAELAKILPHSGDSTTKYHY